VQVSGGRPLPCPRQAPPAAPAARPLHGKSKKHTRQISTGWRQWPKFVQVRFHWLAAEAKFVQVRFHWLSAEAKFVQVRFHWLAVGRNLTKSDSTGWRHFFFGFSDLGGPQFVPGGRGGAFRSPLDPAQVRYFTTRPAQNPGGPPGINPPPDPGGDPTRPGRRRQGAGGCTGQPGRAFFRTWWPPWHPIGGPLCFFKTPVLRQPVLAGLPPARPGGGSSETTAGGRPRGLGQ
jgi:hypothetical protein